jgi:dTDP-glucose 4,6-dehydratase
VGVTNICNHLNDSIGDKLNGISDFKELISYVEDQPEHDVCYAIGASKINKLLGWHPEETFETGLKKTIEWYLANTTWCNNVQNGSY